MDWNALEISLESLAVFGQWPLPTPAMVENSIRVSNHATSSVLSCADMTQG